MTGKLPFPGTATQMMTDRQVKDIPKPSTLRAGIPGELDEIVRKMGAKDQHQRFQSTKELVMALHSWLPVADWAALSVQMDPKPGDARTPVPVKVAERGFLSTIRLAFRRLMGKKS